MHKGLLIADLHIGVVPCELLYNEIKNTIFPLLEQKKYDYIIFLGDYFDHKFQLNEDNSFYSLKIMQEIVKRCKKDIKIRMVYGTKSHEWDQYKILSTFSSEYDFRIIYQVEEEELFPDMKILYLPEEYVDNKYDYYKDYFDSECKYDYVFGHGVIQEVMKEASLNIENSKDTKRKKVATFTSGELERVCKGNVFFGHYHIHSNIHDKVFYVGSFTRWQFGEEDEKGIYEVSYDGKEYYQNFIINEPAPTYKTITFGYQNDIFQNTDLLNKKMKWIDQMVKNKVFEHVRFEFNIPKSFEQPEAMIKQLKDKYKYKSNIKLEFRNGYIEEKKDREQKEKQELLDKYEPLLDKSMDVEDKISFFINLEYHQQMDPKKISKYLYNSLEDVLKTYRVD